MTRVRSLYDSSFTRDLAAFDCAVEFDWTKHLQEFAPTLPPEAIEMAGRLGKVHHRVNVNPKGATVTSEPNSPEFGDSKAAPQLEQVLNTMVTQGLTVWVPFGNDLILPVKPTKFHFEKTDAGYMVGMTGEGIEGNLLLSADLRIMSGHSQLPQPLRFTTSFIDGPRGYLLASVTTGSPDGSTGDATFSYTYQAVDGFQIPANVTVSPSTTKPWHFNLTGCKVVKFVKVNVLPPPG